jgi:hypothetical protein
MRRALFLIAVILPSVAGAGPRETARELLRQGVAMLGRRDCASALDRFTRARDAFPSSYKVEVNIGSALECLGRAAEAADRFAEFLRRADPEVDRDMTLRVGRKLAALRKRLATVTLAGVVAGALVAVDGRELGETPLPGPFHLLPGRHRLDLSKQHSTVMVALDVNAGEQRSVTAALAVVPPRAAAAPAPTNAAAVDPLPEPARRAAPRRSTPIYKRWWFWSVIGAAVVGGTAGLVAYQTSGDDRMPSGAAAHIVLK